MTFNRSLFFTTVGLLFAVLLVPLYVNNSLFFPFITGKNFAFRILVELAALGWVMLMIRDRSFRPKMSWLTISIAAFVLIIAVADAFGSNPVKSFLSNFERMEGWITLAHLFVYYLILSSVFLSWTYWKRFFQFSVAVSAIICIHGFMQLAGAVAIHQSTSRLDASFGNATYLAVYMLFHVFITLFLLVRHYQDRDQNVPWYADLMTYVYVGMVFIQSTILFFTATRGSILALIGGLIVTSVLVAVTERKSKVLRNISFVILGIIAVLTVSFLLARNSSFVRNNEVLSRLASISATDNTTKSRFMIWNMAWQGATQDPKHFMIGWGQESFNYVFAKYYDPRMYAQEQWFDRSHDVFLDWLVAGGALGLASYLLIFGCALFYIWKKSNFTRLEKSLLTGLLAGYFIHNVFVFDNLVSYVMCFIVLGFIGFSAQKPAEMTVTKKVEKDEDRTYEYAGMVVAAIVVIALFYQYSYVPISANLTLMQAIRPSRLSAESTGYVYTQYNVDMFKKAIAYNTVGLYETREQLMDVGAKAISGNSDNAVKQEFMKLTQTEIERQLKETPEDVRYYALAGIFYQNIGDYANADIFLNKAVAFNPKKQSLLFAVGSNQFAMKQYTKALETFRQAYELDTSFAEAKKYYALVALYAGHQDVTDELLGPGPVMDPRFLSAYRSSKTYPLMIAYLEKNVEQKPQDIEARVALAAGYVTVKNITKAVTALQAAKTLTTDASAQSQLDAIIKDVKAGKNPFQTAQ